MSLKIKAKLVEHGIRQEDVAKRLGITLTTLSKKLNGKADWWLGELGDLYEMFKELGYDYSIDELVKDTPVKV